MEDDPFIHIVTYQEVPYLKECLSALESLGASDIEVTHNGALGEEEARAIIESSKATFFFNRKNLGFSAAHNQGVKRFLQSDKETLLILNSDLRLEDGALELMHEVLFRDAQIGMVAPLLIRADQDLNPLEPKTIDSTGIQFTLTLRHLDRDSDRLLSDLKRNEEFVSGLSGACILMKRSFVEDMLLVGSEHDSDLFDVFPELREGYEERAPLFDEAFFAYREDAELSLRAKARGWKMVFTPKALGYHVRKVTPERREALSPEINRHGVRNRFLLQILHWSPLRHWYTIIPGFIWRNTLVVAGVIFKERSSLSAFSEVRLLFNRACERRSLMRR